ncbi:hypothetical protein HanXRQr2_Chr01g0033611 [Helianthus annuus]|uniref:Uncharacterized protein n=1 Tax=Helianthus annuus TaxID=4232 RepID=A0A9K3P361_HELAN|nr:hypothetical protein HanXRQr2_Chr01g0033611 [Helianthus annuus]
MNHTLLLVTESLTLIAGNNRVPLACIWYNLLTPVVVSSDTPTNLSFILWYFFGSVANPSLIIDNTIWNSALSVEVGSGNFPVFSNSSSALTPSWINKVASPPSSTIRSGPPPGPQSKARSVHHQYSLFPPSRRTQQPNRER